MWAFTWVPNPSTNRPWLYRCKSQAICASTVGERGNATAMPVPNVSRWLCSAAKRKWEKRVVRRLGGPDAVEAQGLRGSGNGRHLLEIVGDQIGVEFHSFALLSCKS